MKQLLPILVLCLLTLACANPLQDARTLSQTDPGAALRLIEAHLEETPADLPWLEAEGDVHLNAMDGPSGDRAHADAAVDAYTRLVDAHPRRGIYKAKLALAQTLTEVDDAHHLAAAAWDCCRDASAIPLVSEPRILAGVVSQGTWQAPTTWTAIPGYVPEPPGRLVIRTDAPAVTAVDGGEAPALEIGTVAPVVAPGDPVTFLDRTSPRTAPAFGFVDGRLCDQPHEGLDCRARSVKRSDIHAGPCWHAEEPPEGDEEIVDPDAVDWTGVRCVPGEPAAQAEHCPHEPGSCKVTYEAITHPKLRIARSDVWLLPGSGPVPEQALVWGSDLAGADVSDDLAAGNIALGLPEPLVRWAARTSPDAPPDAFLLEEGHIALVWRSDAGTFTFTDGVLSAWSPPQTP